MNEITAIVVPEAEATLPPPSALALNLPKNMTFEQWEEVGAELSSRQRVLNWWIGDWWAAGHHRYGERAKVAAEGMFGKEFQTIMDIASVCRSFETSRRHEGLSFTHHREVAGLPPEEADALLERALKENLSTRDLRTEVMKGNVIKGRAAPAPKTDPEYQEFLAIAHAWNNARESVREDVAFIIAEIGTGIIEL